MKESIGILINKLENSQLCLDAALLCDQAKQNGVNAAIYYNHYTTSPLAINSRCAMMQMCDIIQLKGIAIATDYHTSRVLITSKYRFDKFLYVNTLEYFNQNNYEFYRDLYYNNYKLLSATIEIQKILKNVWGVESILIENLNFDQLKKHGLLYL